MQYRLKETRQQAGLTQEEVAEQLNTAQVIISRYENGRQELSFARAIDLADLYKVSLDYLAGRAGYNK